jgi:prophage antirepressor-like protein
MIIVKEIIHISIYNYMNSLQKFNKFGHTINVYGTVDKPLFKASEIGKVLELTNVHTSLSQIDEKFKVLRSMDTIKGLQKMTFLTEPGLYQLIFKSRKQEAVEFQMWIYEDVLPSIRKTGRYEISPPEYHERLTFKIETEKDLHQKVVNFIRNTYPNALIIASLGELHYTEKNRM